MYGDGESGVALDEGSNDVAHAAPALGYAHHGLAGVPLAAAHGVAGYPYAHAVAAPAVHA